MERHALNEAIGDSPWMHITMSVYFINSLDLCRCGQTFAFSLSFLLQRRATFFQRLNPSVSRKRLTPLYLQLPCVHLCTTLINFLQRNLFAIIVPRDGRIQRLIMASPHCFVPVMFTDKTQASMIACGSACILAGDRGELNTEYIV